MIIIQNHPEFYGNITEMKTAFANNSSANIKLSKTRLSKIAQPGGILPFVLQHQRIH